MEQVTLIWNTLLVYPILNLLMVFHKLLSLLGIPGSFGFAIILLTIATRLLLYPLFTAQAKSMKKMQALKPHMDRIRKLYKGDTARQQQETMKLYKEHNINPASGCLPLLIQSPILIALYSGLFELFKQTDPVNHINTIVYSPFLKIDHWDPNFFIVSISDFPSNWTKGSIILLAVPIVTALLQFVQTKMMTPKVAEEIVEKAAANKSVDSSDFANIMQKQMLYFFPVMIGFFSYTLPVGLSLYWNTFSVFGIIQQYFINKKK